MSVEALQVADERPTIIFVDGDIATIERLADHIRSEFQVLTVDCGAEALALLERGEHDIGMVIADQKQMAHMTGVELLTIVRDRYPDVGRMLITGLDDFRPVVEAMNQGQICGYIKKPWDLMEVRVSLRTGLERVLLGRRLRAAEWALVRAERDGVLECVTSGFVHELNQHTAVLRMNLEIMRGEFGGILMGEDDGKPGELVRSEFLEASLSDCLDAVASLSVMSEDLRVIVNRSRETSVLMTDLNAAVRRALRFTLGNLRHRGAVKLELQEVPPVTADESGLTFVLLNLMVHALQYWDDDSSRRINVAIRSFEAEDCVKLTICDDGPGIPSAELDSVFEPLKARGTEGRAPRIGLVLSKRMVDMWGGAIAIDAARSSGTRYELSLGISGGAGALRSAESGFQEEACKERVLVIDDEPSVLRAIQRILRGTYDVEVTDSGELGIERLCGNDYDAVLCDLQMPLVDGMEVYVRATKRKPGLISCFGFMTGGAVSNRAAAFLEEVGHTGVAVIEKPFDHARVRAVIAELVSRATAPVSPCVPRSRGA